MSDRDWASLERGLLRDIFTRLPTDVDATNFRFVCGGWRVAAGAGTPVPRPWMMLKSADDDSAPHAFVHPKDRRRRTRNRKPAVRVDSVIAVPREEWPSAASVIRGASRGWLAVNEGERLLLRDPISRAEVPLPAFDDAGYKMFDVFLSDDPLAAPGSWTAFAFFRWDDVNTHHLVGDVLAFCRPGDAEWARVDPVDDNGDGGGHVHHGHHAAGQQQQIQRYRGLEFFAGRPYVLLTKPSRLAVCDVEARRLVVSTVTIYTEYDGYQECLVECGGDLLVVQVLRRNEFTPSPCPWYCPGSHRFERHRVVYSAKAFRVKLDDGADGVAGMPVATLRAASTGDYAVFVAPRGHAFALPASGFPAVRAGSVYFFAVDYTRRVKGMVVVDLVADPTRHDTFVRKLPVAGNWHVLSWFCPRQAVLDATPTQRRSRRCSLLDAWRS